MARTRTQGGRTQRTTRRTEYPTRTPTKDLPKGVVARPPKPRPGQPRRPGERYRGLKNDKVEARDSRIHGRGLFARRDLEKDELLIEYLGDKITKGEANRRYAQQEKRGRVYIFELNSRYDLDGDIGDNPAKYANHSCDPNAETINEKGHVWIVARRPIRKGEEVVYDYNFPYDDWHERPCRCGSDKCRGYIVGSDAFRNLKRRWKRVGKRATMDLDEDETPHIARHATEAADRPERCVATTKAGKPCSKPRAGRSKYCAVHKR